MMRLAWSRWRRFRHVVQILAFAGFAYLLAEALPRRAAFPLADLFLRLDPLAALATMVASRTWLPGLALALLTVALTLLAGRAWCGWLCPLGSLLEWASFPRAGRRPHALASQWRRIKYLLLSIIVAAALCGSLALLAIDPLVMSTRVYAAVILPGLSHVARALEAAIYRLTLLHPGLEWLEGPLSAERRALLQNALVAVPLVAFVALNAVAGRFWCRYLCPLGALLGLMARISLLGPAVGTACSRCKRCHRICPADAVESAQDLTIRADECTVCLACLDACPQQSIGFGWRWRAQPRYGHDPVRRHLLAMIGASVAGATLWHGGRRVVGTHSSSPVIRPPGVDDEAAFLARCLRCGQCLRVCTTSGLQPALLEGGLEALWTPRLVPYLGYCDYGCNACGQVCPSGAIPPLDLESKRQTVMGHAVIDREVCLPWVQGVPCIVCEEMCPRPDKAIRLEEATVCDERGQLSTVQRPHVEEGLCVGCGICEYRCPADSGPAIRIHPCA